MKNPRRAFELVLLSVIERNVPRVQRVSQLTGAGMDEVAQYFKELKDDPGFINRLNLSIRKHEVVPVNGMLTPCRAHVVYAICRAVKPEVMVETGVASGISTSFILEAMHMNKRGRLYSIDYPGFHRGKESGWLVPRGLRYRWSLIIGKSSKTLKPLLEKLKSIDVFLHDSDHSYENMRQEFRCSWAYLRSGGFLLSDDILANSAFQDFAKEVKRNFIDFYNFGGLRK